MKGISGEVVPYAVDGLLREVGRRPQVISEHAQGLDLFVDLDVIDERGAERARRRLAELLAALEGRAKPP
jgi:adenylate cyclase